MNIEQRAISFFCQGSSLVGIVDVPERPLPRGLLLLADGPQYRVGGQRQFTLLSRALAVRGIPVMRFDRRGMGDSEGSPRESDAIDDDIAAALKEFFIHMPDMNEVVLLGLGDAAAAAALYAPRDARVRGLVLLNPGTGERQAPDTLGHHYLARLGEVAFWKRLATGRLDFAASAQALRQNVRERRGALSRRVAASLAAFPGQVLLVVGGADGAAQEAAHLLSRRHPRHKRVDVPGAGHSFAGSAWREQVAASSANWLVSW
jgi:exosortase A-associated hydrolase 1